MEVNAGRFRLQRHERQEERLGGRSKWGGGGGGGLKGQSKWKGGNARGDLLGDVVDVGAALVGADRVGKADLRSHNKKAGGGTGEGGYRREESMAAWQRGSSQLSISHQGVGSLLPSLSLPPSASRSTQSSIHGHAPTIIIIISIIIIRYTPNHPPCPDPAPTYSPARIPRSLYPRAITPATASSMRTCWKLPSLTLMQTSQRSLTFS